MANYYGTTRTNYFAVKDGAAFEKELEDFPVQIISQTGEDGVTRYGFLDSNVDGAGLDWSYWDHDTDDSVEIDWLGILAKHLADGEVAIIMEVGAEKYRYLVGTAIAVNNKGETREVDLNKDIARLALELGSNVTSVTY